MEICEPTTKLECSPSGLMQSLLPLSRRRTANESIQFNWIKLWSARAGDFLSAQIFAARRPDDLLIVVDEIASQKSTFHPAAELGAFER